MNSDRNSDRNDDTEHDMRHDATPETVLRRSDQDTSGAMGVSSEREGPAGPGQHGTSGLRHTGPIDDVEVAVEGGELPPEFRPGGAEANPVGLEPKAGYPSLDPRSGDA